MGAFPRQQWANRANACTATTYRLPLDGNNGPADLPVPIMSASARNVMVVAGFIIHARTFCTDSCVEPVSNLLTQRTPPQHTLCSSACSRHTVRTYDSFCPFVCRVGWSRTGQVGTVGGVEWASGARVG